MAGHEEIAALERLMEENNRAMQRARKLLAELRARLEAEEKGSENSAQIDSPPDQGQAPAPRKKSS